MLKKILLMIAALFSLHTYALEINYNITSGKLHSGGKATVILKEISETDFLIGLHYEIYKKPLAPIPDQYLKGEDTLLLPIDFLTEVGYLELESKGSMEVNEATIVYQKRFDTRDLKNAHLVTVIPKNEKSNISITYHPSITAPGWAKVAILLKNKIQILNNYEIVLEKVKN